MVTSTLLVINVQDVDGLYGAKKVSSTDIRMDPPHCIVDTSFQTLSGSGSGPDKMTCVHIICHVLCTMYYVLSRWCRTEIYFCYSDGGLPVLSCSTNHAPRMHRGTSMHTDNSYLVFVFFFLFSQKHQNTTVVDKPRRLRDCTVSEQ